MALVLSLLDRPMREALGLPRPPRTVGWFVRGALRTRGWIVRRLPARSQERPFVLKTRTYPDGHELDELGPQRVLARMHAAA